jgi:hypothetical protein
MALGGVLVARNHAVLFPNAGQDPILPFVRLPASRGGPFESPPGVQADPKRVLVLIHHAAGLESTSGEFRFRPAYLNRLPGQVLSVDGIDFAVIYPRMSPSGDGSSFPSLIRGNIVNVLISNRGGGRQLNFSAARRGELRIGAWRPIPAPRPFSEAFHSYRPTDLGPLEVREYIWRGDRKNEYSFVRCEFTPNPMCRDNISSIQHPSVEFSYVFSPYLLGRWLDLRWRVRDFVDGLYVTARLEHQ